MAIKQIIEIIGKVSGLNTATDELLKLGEVSAQTAAKLSSFNAELTKSNITLKELQNAANAGAASLNGLAQGIQNVSKAYQEGFAEGIAGALQESGVAADELRSRIDALSASQEELLRQQQQLESQNASSAQANSQLTAELEEQNNSIEQGERATVQMTTAQKLANLTTKALRLGVQLLKKTLDALISGGVQLALEAVVENFDKIRDVAYKLIPGIKTVAEWFTKAYNAATDFLGLTSEEGREVDALRERMERYNKTLERNVRVYRSMGDNKKAYEAERQQILNNLRVLDAYEKVRKLNAEEEQERLNLRADLIVLDNNYSRSLEKTGQVKKEVTMQTKDFVSSMKELNTEFVASDYTIAGLRTQLIELGHAIFRTSDPAERAILMEAIKATEEELNKLVSDENIEQIRKWNNQISSGFSSTVPGAISDLEAQLSHIENTLRNMSPDDPNRMPMVQLFIEMKKKLEEAREELEHLKNLATLEELFNDPDFDMFAPFVESSKRATEEATKKAKEDFDKLKEHIKNAMFEINEKIIDGFSELEAQKLKQRFEEETYNLEQRKNQELANKELTEQQKAQIEKRYAVEQAKLKVRQFEAERQMRIQLATMDAALAVVKLAAQYPPVGPTAAMFYLGAASIAVTTGFQIAKIKQEKPPQIPAYRKGTKSAKGGLSLVGEEGPELTNLPRGSRVYTAKETAKVFSYMNTLPDLADMITGRLPVKSNLSNIQVGPGGISDIDYDRIGKSVAENVRIENTSVNFNADAKGFGLFLRKGLNTVNHRGSKKG